MKVKEITQRGKPVVLVDGKINGKRKRMFFDTKPQAERWLKAEAKDVTCQQWWIGLSNSDRIDMMNAFERSRSIGFTLLSAVDHFATAGSGKNFLKKCTLGEAVGYAYVDERVKADSPRCRHRGRPEKVFEPSGFLGAKARKGCSKNTLYTLQTVVHSFRDFIGADTQVATITPEMIESWLDAGAWGNTTKEGYNRQVKNLFNWMIKRDYVKDNPASKIEEIIRVEFDPQILTVEQATKFMELTRKESPALLTSAALNLFCGIRPSEVRRLSQQDISFADKEVALKGNQTKTRRRRYVDISDNCLAWMKLGAKLPIANHNHEWANRLAKQTSRTHEQIKLAWRLAVGRNPADAELVQATAHLRVQREHFDKKENADHLALASLCHVLLNSNEFIYVD